MFIMRFVHIMPILVVFILIASMFHRLSLTGGEHQVGASIPTEQKSI